MHIHCSTEHSSELNKDPLGGGGVCRTDKARPFNNSKLSLEVSTKERKEKQKKPTNPTNLLNDSFQHSRG